MDGPDEHHEGEEAPPLGTDPADNDVGATEPSPFEGQKDARSSGESPAGSEPLGDTGGTGSQQPIEEAGEPGAREWDPADDEDDVPENEEEIYFSSEEQESGEEHESTEETPQAVAGRDYYYAGERIEQVQRDKITGEIVNVWNTSGFTEEPRFEHFSQQLLQKLSALFVPPPGFEAIQGQLGGLQHQRVVLVHGPDHSGKWTCAVNFAQRLCETERTLEDIVQYSRPLDSEISLLEALGSENFWRDARHSVVLLRDCFERRVRREELEPAQVQDLNDLLLHSKSVLVLTGDVAREHLASLAVIKLAAQVEDLHEVLEKNLRYQIEHEDLRLTESQVDVILGDRLWAKLQASLATPFHIHQFCSKLGSILLEAQDHSALEKLVLRLAVEVAIGGREAARTWFDALHPNEKLLALLVYLFPGAERRWLEEREQEIVERFRAGGLRWFSDPRILGTEDSRARIHAVEQGGRLEFDDRSYDAEARRQVENRQRLLWEAVEPLVALHPDEDWLEGWKRQALGVALGRLGLHDISRLMSVVEEMAASESNRTSVVPGYAFQELIRQDPSATGPHVLGTLRSWIRSPAHRLMWSAGAALWRVYLVDREIEDEVQRQAIKRQALSLIRLLARNLAAFRVPERGRKPHEAEGGQREAAAGRGSKEHKRIWRANFRCVAEAMRQIALGDPERAAVELRDWLLSGDASLVGLARMTVRTIYETFSVQQFRPTETQRVAFLRLIPSLLGNASDESRDVETVFLALRGWLRWDGFRERIRGELLHFATFGEALVRARLRSIVSRTWLDPEPAAALRISEKVIRTSTRGQQRSETQAKRSAAKLAASWCEGTEEEAHRIAQAVIARCFAMDGTLPTLPCMGSGTVIVDPELLLPSPRVQAVSASAVWSLLALLESRLNLAFLPLGEARSIDLLDGGATLFEPLPRFPGHRLLLPGLEKVPESHRKDVFVLAARAPHDFADLAGQSWPENLHFVGPSNEGATVEDPRQDGYVHLPLSWPPSVLELEATISALETGWARALASASGQHWQELTRAFHVESSDPSTCMARVEALAREVDSPLATSDPHDDPVWKILALTLWLAATDLPTCLSWIVSWLTVEEGGPEVRAKRAIGTAAASALIRLYTAYPPDPAGVGRAPTLLFDTLSDPLAQQGSDGVDAVLRLVSHWLEDAFWAAHLAGDVYEGEKRLERWAAEHLERRPELASELVARLDACRSAGLSGQSWEALEAVVGRLKALRALEHPQVLPEIGPDQRYAILVFDAGSNDENLRRRLAAITVELYRGLARNGVSTEEASAPLSQQALIPAIYRLGAIRPFWAAADAFPAPDRLLPRGMRLPRFIGPLLESLDEKRDQVATVVLISSDKPLDLDDWSLSGWWKKVKIYGDGSSPYIPSFCIVPEPMRLAGIEDEKRQMMAEAAELASFLQKSFELKPTNLAKAPESGSGEGAI